MDESITVCGGDFTAGYLASSDCDAPASGQLQYVNTDGTEETQGLVFFIQRHQSVGVESGSSVAAAGSSAASESCVVCGIQCSDSSWMTTSGGSVPHARLLADILHTEPSKLSEILACGSLCVDCTTLLDDIDACGHRLQQLQADVRVRYNGMLEQRAFVHSTHNITVTGSDGFVAPTSADSSVIRHKDAVGNSIPSPVSVPYSAHRQENDTPATGTDTGSDTVPDTGTDTVLDTVLDTGTDTVLDTVSDTVPDTGTDNAAADVKCSRHVCELCGRQFTRAHSLRVHRRVHDDIRPYVCSVCARPFRERHALTRHMLIHSDARPHACRLCDARFRQLGVLRRHERTHSGDRPHRCALCPRAFIERRALVAHQLRHAGRLPFHCSRCDKSFSDAFWFGRHQMRHAGQLPHRCQLCAKAFTDARVLRAHVRATHTAERPFVCDVCAARFSSASHLSRHARTHTGDRPFDCPVCRMAFADRSTLKRHAATHARHKRYDCDRCGRTFERRDGLQTHRRSAFCSSDDPARLYQLQPVPFELVPAAGESAPTDVQASAHYEQITYSK